MTTYEEATTVRTSSDILAADIAALDEMGVYASGWSPLSVHRGVLELNSRSQSVAEGIRSVVTKAGFADTVVQAGDAWTKRFVKGYYNLDPNPATSAVHVFRVRNLASSGPHNIKVGQLVASTPDGILFKNTEAKTLPSGAGQYIELEFAAEAAGLGGNIPPGTTLAWEQGIPGTAVENPAVSGTGTSIKRAGREEESAASLLARGLARWGATAAGGSADSYVEWIGEAFKAAGVPNTITRWRVDDANPNGPGSVDVYLANAAGPATAGELAIVNAYLQKRHGKGRGPLRVLAAEEVSIPVQAILYVTGAPDAVSIASSRLAVYGAAVGLGGIVYLMELIELLMGVPGVYNISLSLPVDNVALSTNQIPVFVPSLVAE